MATCGSCGGFFADYQNMSESERAAFLETFYDDFICDTDPVTIDPAAEDCARATKRLCEHPTFGQWWTECATPDGVCGWHLDSSVIEQMADAAVQNLTTCDVGAQNRSLGTIASVNQDGASQGSVQNISVTTVPSSAVPCDGYAIATLTSEWRGGLSIGDGSVAAVFANGTVSVDVNGTAAETLNADYLYRVSPATTTALFDTDTKTFHVVVPVSAGDSLTWTLDVDVQVNQANGTTPGLNRLDLLNGYQSFVFVPSPIGVALA